MLALQSWEEVDGGRLDSVDLRQLLTAWLDCRNWTEEYIPRVVELESSGSYGKHGAAETCCTASLQCCSAAVLSSLLVHVKTYVDNIDEYFKEMKFSKLYYHHHHVPKTIAEGMEIIFRCKNANKQAQNLYIAAQN